MTGQLDGLGSVVRKLIKTFGKTGTITRRAETFSPATGRVTTVETDYACVVTPPEPIEYSRLRTMTKVGTAVCAVAREGLSITPDLTTDVLVLGSSTWQVVAVEPVYSGELVAMFILQLKQ